MKPTLETFTNIREEMAGSRVHSGTSRVKSDKYYLVTVAVNPSLCGLKNTVSRKPFMAKRLWQPTKRTSMSGYLIKHNIFSAQNIFIECSLVSSNI